MRSGMQSRWIINYFSLALNCLPHIVRTYYALTRPDRILNLVKAQIQEDGIFSVVPKLIDVDEFPNYVNTDFTLPDGSMIHSFSVCWAGFFQFSDPFYTTSEQWLNKLLQFAQLSSVLAQISKILADLGFSMYDGRVPFRLFWNKNAINITTYFHDDFVIISNETGLLSARLEPYLQLGTIVFEDVNQFLLAFDKQAKEHFS